MRKIVNKKEQKSFRQYLRNSMNKGERLLWWRLKNSQLGFKFRRQTGFGKYIVDFYCPEVKMVIEIDGLTHYEEEVYNKDVIREKFLINLGLIVKRYNSGLIFENIDEVVEDIYQCCTEIKASAPPLASAFAIWATDGQALLREEGKTKFKPHHPSPLLKEEGKSSHPSFSRKGLGGG